MPTAETLGAAFSFARALFRCRHSRPMRMPTTLEGEEIPHFTCEKCAARIPYDWDRMRNSTTSPPPKARGFPCRLA